MKHSNTIPNKFVVGVLGIGDLGHYSIQFAKAFGAKLISISHSEVKRDIAFQIGCDEYLNCSDIDAMSKYQNQSTHILCAGTSSDFECEFLFFNSYSKLNVNLICVYTLREKNTFLY